MVSQSARIDLDLVSNISNINTTELADKLETKLNDAVRTDAANKMDGTFAGWNGGTNQQQFQLIDQKTKTNIKSAMDNKMDTYRSQQGAITQSTRRLVMPQGCNPGGANMRTTVSNDSYAKQTLMDLATVVTEAIIKSKSGTETTTTMDTKSDLQSKDTFGQLRDGITAVSGDVFGAVNTLGMTAGCGGFPLRSRRWR